MFAGQYFALPLMPVFAPLERAFLPFITLAGETKETGRSLLRKGLEGCAPRRGESSHGAERHGRSDSGAPESPVSGAKRRKCAQIT
jgi:hypothetical protein